MSNDQYIDVSRTATGVTLFAITEWFDVAARYQQIGTHVTMTYSSMMMAFIGLTLWLNQSLKNIR